MKKSNFICVNKSSGQRYQFASLFATPFALALSALYTAASLAEETAVHTLPQVEVIGGQADSKKAQGSATVIESSTLEESRVFNVNEALRKVPGVHVREEEGVGLRPNIGIRGMNPTRSTKVLLLEDGLPLSYAPYGDNASYYHPPIDRYDSIEVSKGSQVIRFGPQTAGGVINYITPVPQKEFGGIAGFSAGSRGYLNAHTMITGNGVIADIYRKESDGARENMHSQLDDLNFKWAGQLKDDHKLVLRATHFREHSQLTYSGLTQAEFVNLGARYNPFKNDYFDANRTGMSATHEWQLNADAKLLTSLYGAYFERDWWRQASTTTGSLSCASGAGGTPRISGVALTDTDLNACRFEGRLRNYATTGVDSRLFQRHNSFGLASELEVGVKYQSEVQRRRQEDYATYSAYLSNGASTLSENRRRTTNAITAFVSNKMQVNDRFAVTPILRVENIHHEHSNPLLSQFGQASFTEFIPGVGATYQVDADNLIYGGVHKGFSPPRVEDAISGSTTVDLNAEKSINAELGLRSTPAKNVFIDVAVFRNDFSNLIQVGSIAGGSTSYQEGKALIQGAELAGQIDKLTNAVAGNMFVRMAFTHIPTADQKSSFTSSAGTGAVGNRLPYAPENTLTLTLGYRAPANWNSRLEYVYVGKQFTDFDNTVAPDSNGQSGQIDAYGIWNASFNYTVDKATLFIAGKNLADSTYIVDRTRGIQVGMPRTIQAGIKYAF